MDTNMAMGGSFFNPGPFMPHGGCYLWTQSLIALHALSDGAIGLAYYAIPLILLHFVRQRKDLKFKWIFLCFAAFVLACGTTHLMEIWNIWHANYWLSGLLKAVTALVSVFTTILLVKLLPAALVLPSAEDLRQAHAALEIRVQERTTELRRTERALRTIIDCNQKLVRAGSEAALLEEICRVIVETGGYSMAWVGFAENDVDKSVRVAAWAGSDDGYLARSNISWDETCERGRGPTGTAIRTGQIVVSPDIRTDPTIAPWRAEALKRGYLSAMVLPLRNGEMSFGVLTIYAAEANAFNPADIELLRELADDLAYGIQALRTRLEHRQAESALEQERNLLRTLVDHIPDMIYVRDTANRFLLANQTFARRMGVSVPAGLIGKTDADFYPAEVAAQYAAADRKIFADGKLIDYDCTFAFPNGEKLNILNTKVPLKNAQGDVVGLVGICHDITARKQAEEAVRESERRYRSLFELESDAIILVDCETHRYVDANLSALRLYGYSREELLQMTPEHVSEEPEKTRATIGTGQFFIPLRWHRKKNGERFAAEITTSQIDYRGRRTELATIRDITERKQAEQALANEQALLRSLVDNLPVAVYLKDLAGRKILANPVDLRNMGLTSEAQVLGKTDFDLFPPAEAATFYADDQLVVQTGQPVLNREEKLTRRDGSVRCLLTSKVPVFDHAGAVTGLAGIGLDITERKRAEEQLNLQFSALTAAANAIVITDPTGKIEWVNPSFTRVTGYSAEEVIGRNPRVLKSGEHPPQFYADLWAAITTGQVWQGELMNKRKNGRLYTEEMTITPVRGTDGKITHFVAIKQDVTEERMLQNRMQQTQKLEAIGTLAGGIAHDFNNMLAAMFGYCYLLEQDTQGNRAAQESIAEIFKAANRAKELVQQILTFSRKREQKREVIQLEPIVKEAAKFLRASLPAQINIEKSFAADTPAVLADPTQVYQVAMNLATNALHAMEDRPGTLTVNLESFQPEEDFLHVHPECRPVPYARLTVADTGQGMDARTLERIFEPFFTTKPTGKGTGLGLAVVHGIVQAHEGFITVESQVGRGTTFRVYFPAQAADAAAIETTAAQLPRGQGQNLLLVDDEPALTRSLRQLLSRLNYQITTSNSPREAIVLFQQDPARFDLVITDLAMPEMNGLAVARQLHALRPDLPVLLTSGFTSDLTPENLREAGIQEVVPKPVSLTLLAAVVQRALAGQKNLTNLSN